MYRPDEDRYVLFASYDSLFSTYNVRVAVAGSITGPYRDFNGAAMTDLEQEPGSIGTKVLGSYRFDGDTGWLAPGHNSVFTRPGQAGDEHFIVHHVRFAEDPSQHAVQLRRLFFTEAGWPVVSPQPFAGEAEEVIKTPQAISGKWLVIRLDPSSTELVNAVAAEVDTDAAVLSDGSPANVMVRVSVELDGVALDGVDVDSVVFASWDWSKGQAALSFSGIDKDGVVWSGTKES
jgi:arabinan endo-1,5-alpha-L-arabinosidase